MSFHSNERDRDRDDDDKKSWRELDRQRDRSTHRRESSERGHQSSRQQRQQQLHKQQLESLFKAKKPSGEQAKALEKIRKARVPRDITAACQAYVQKFPLPADWDSLLLFIDCSSADILVESLHKLEKLYADQPPAAQKTFVQQLRLLKMMSDDPIVEHLAEAINQKLCD